MPLLLKTLGGLTLEADGAPAALHVRRRPLVLLAFITGAGRDGVSREKALAYFWPDSDEERARSSLRQSLFTLRRDAGADLLSLGEHTLRADRSVLRVDAFEFEDALARRDYEEASRWYGGSFLDGVSLAGLGELDIWIDARRRQFAVRHADALQALVADATRRGDTTARVRWARQLVAADPLSAATALALLEALGAAGDRTAALDFGRVHAARVRAELGLEPDPAVTEYMDWLRRQTTPARSMPAFGTMPEAPAAFAPAPAASAPSTLATPSPPLPARSHSLRRAFLGAAGLVAAAALFVLPDGWSARTRDAVDPTHRIPSPSISVAPFRVITNDSAVRLVGDSAATLLVESLRRSGFVTVADGRSPSDAGSDQIQRAFTLSGEIVGDRAAATVRAVLAEVRDGGVADAVTLVGPAERLVTALDAIALRAAAAANGEPSWRLDALATHARAAVVHYLAGQSAMRRGELEAAGHLFARALDADSTLALAALGMARAGSLRFASEVDRLSLSPRRAYALRDSLGPRDRALFDAFADPPDHLKSSAERLAAWEHAARLVPDQADVWYELGDALFHEGRRVGVDDPWGRARAAFTRARARDHTYAPAVAHLLELAAASGDTSALRALAESYFAGAPDADVEHFLRWRVAISLGDDRARERLRSELPRATEWSLMRIVGMSQIHGEGLDDGTVALAALSGTAANATRALTARVAEHAWALNAGRPRDAMHALERIRAVARPEVAHDRAFFNPDEAAVLDALFWDGDTASARTSAAILERRLGRDPGRGLRETTERSADACVVALWHLSSGNVTGARNVLATSGRPAPADAAPCVEIANAWLSTIADSSSADRYVDHLDAYLRSGHQQFGVDMGNLVLARLAEQHGRPSIALAAVRRRAYHWTDGPWYLSTYLREEGRLAAITGDTAGAVRAYRHYLALRAGAEARTTTDAAVRRALAELESAP